MRKSQNTGYTLIEMMIIVAVLLAIIAGTYVYIDQAMEKSYIAKAHGELNQLRTAITRMAIDTRTLPYGSPRDREVRHCEPVPSDYTDGVEHAMQSTGGTGLSAAPTTDDGDSPFKWTAAAVSAWKGPYVPTTFSYTDPWGRSYWFDPDYNPYIDCPGHPNNTDKINQFTSGSPSYNPGDLCGVGYYEDKYSIRAIVSAGPNGLTHPMGNGGYDCDDIFFPV